MKKPKHKNFIVIVDGYRHFTKKRNTAGRYRVGAKNEKEARELVQKAIGFGSALVSHEAKDLLAEYKQVYLERWDPHIKTNYGFALLPARHATSPIQPCDK